MNMPSAPSSLNRDKPRPAEPPDSARKRKINAQRGHFSASCPSDAPRQALYRRPPYSQPIQKQMPDPHRRVRRSLRFTP